MRCARDGCRVRLEPFPATWLADGKEYCSEVHAKDADNTVGRNTDTRVPEQWRAEAEIRRLQRVRDDRQQADREAS